MNEAARQQMLAAIGITPLVPRFVLAGAKPSPQCEVDELDFAEQELLPAAPVAVPPERAVNAARADVDKRAKAPRIDIDTSSRQPSAQPAKTGPNADSAAPRLQVNLIQHHARCFSLLPVYRPDFQAEADQFLRAVMLSLGINSAPISTQLFRWPFATNAKLDLGPSALREALGGFIVHAAREPGSVVLLWGLDLARQLQGDTQYPDPKTAQPGEFALSTALRGIAVHRVQDYFNEPLRKRELWRQLAPLRSVLNTGAA